MQTPRSTVEHLDALFQALEAESTRKGRTRASIVHRLGDVANALDATQLPGVGPLADAVRAAAGSGNRWPSKEALASIHASWAEWRSVAALTSFDEIDTPALQATDDIDVPAVAAAYDLPPIEIDADLMGVFLAETLEHLGSIESSVLALERAGDDPTAVDEVFRSFHTLKGNAGALGFSDIEDLAHSVETLLDRVRSGEHQVGSNEVEVILASVDLLTTMVRGLDRAGARVPKHLADERLALKAALNRILDAGSSRDDAAPADAPAAAAAEPAEAPFVGAQQLLSGSESARAHGAGQPTIKVDMRKVDNLVDLVGELVIVQAMIHLDPRIVGSGDERLGRGLAQARRIASELHRNAISMRLVPIRPTFQRMRRVARDLSRKAGKEIDLTLIGEETELDRKVVEEIADPLMHMLRNAIDHGIEDAETRVRAGKPAAGQLSLAASYEGGSVLISVVDDGRGLDSKKLYDRAVAHGLIEAGAKLSDTEAHALIFRPGISTAGTVTEISGRGIGMDVVRHNVEALRGRIDIRSQPGAGTTFLIKLPLTLATIDGLVLGVSDQRFVLPTFAVWESFRPSQERLHVVPGKGWVVEVRKELLPIVFLSELFGIDGAVADPMQAAVVVVEDEGRRVALVVDQLLGKQEVVIKSLGEMFASVEGVTGGAIMADGRIGLVLDAGSLIRLRSGAMPMRAA